MACGTRCIFVQACPKPPQNLARDAHIEASVEVIIRRNVWTSFVILGRDMAMGLLPLGILALMPLIFGP